MNNKLTSPLLFSIKARTHRRRPRYFSSIFSITGGRIAIDHMRAGRQVRMEVRANCSHRTDRPSGSHGTCKQGQRDGYINGVLLCFP